MPYTVRRYSWQYPVITKATLTPPASPVKDDRYLIGGSGAGGWTGKDNKIAHCIITGSPGTWEYTDPSEGMLVWVDDENQRYSYDGSAWSIPAPVPGAHPLISETGHTVAGLTAGHFMKALTPTTYGFGVHGLTYADVGASASGHNHDASYLGISAQAVDSDKLDGYHYTSFASSGHNHAGVYEPAFGHGDLALIDLPAVPAGKVLDDSGNWVAAGAGDMLKSDNLSGLANYTTARSNLGLGSMATKTDTDYIPKTIYDAYTIVMATADDTPIAITISEEQVVGRITGGAIKGLSQAEQRTMLGLGTMAYETAGNYALKTLWGETGSLVQASGANTPAELLHGAAGQFLKTGGHGAINAWASIAQADVSGLTTADSPSFAGLTLTTPGSITMIPCTSSTTGIIFKGANRFIHDFALAGTDGRNIFIGITAGNFTMTGSSGNQGSYNIGIGQNSLDALTTGYTNVGIGDNALTAVTIGSGNVGIGFSALSAVVGGFDNMGIGNSAGRSITTGNSNTFVGGQAGYHASQKIDAANSMALGANAYTTASNQVVIGDASVTETILRGAITGAISIALSGLTSGRIVTAGAEGRLQDSANLTYDGTTEAIIGTRAGISLQFTGPITAKGRVFQAANNSTGRIDLSSNLMYNGTSYVQDDTAEISSLLTIIGGTFNFRRMAAGGSPTLSQSLFLQSDGVMVPVQAATASAPGYVKGGIYFDTTLNKLRVGGAIAWETITSS